jgi:hypothetical protein
VIFLAERYTLLGDIEIYKNVFLAGFRRKSDGKVLIMEESHLSKIDRAHLRTILMQNDFVGFNSMSFDAPLLWYFVQGASVADMKKAADRIINGGIKWWDVEDAIGVQIPYEFKKSHIDLIEPQPNPFASLKILHARLHGKELRDLPYEPDAVLTDEQIDNLRIYLERSDLPATEKLWDAMSEGMDLRRQIGQMIGQNVMSKSDTQMGLAIVKKRAEEVLGRKIERSSLKAGHTFRYPIPPYISFETSQLRSILNRIREHDFVVQADGKVELPKFLEEPITLGETTYQMGIGGLHSTEANRAVFSDQDKLLIDFDAASFYPAILLTLGLYPDAIGPAFLKVYEGIRKDRLAAKAAKNKAVDKALKIALNGTFGSLGSRYSFVYAPHLLIAVTLTGQLALLMLIERAEQMGIGAVSGNTDGIVLSVPRSMFAGWIKDEKGKDTVRPAPSALADLIHGWERDTGFDMEGTEYLALYNQSVNSYFAIKPNGGHKRKGPFANPWSDHPDDKDARASLMKNPQMTICSDAALAKIKHGTPVRETIESCTDIRQFITVIRVTAGATWRGDYLGKVIRYYYSTNGDEVFESKPNKLGNYKKVPKTDGAAPCMTLPDELPCDIDYDRYVVEAEQILKDIGYYGAVKAPEKRVRITKENRSRMERAWALLL